VVGRKRGREGERKEKGKEKKEGKKEESVTMKPLKFK
jgi:hypothetical protein